MRNFVVLALVIIISSFTNPQDEILGTWIPEEGNSKVEIYKKDGRYFGKVAWLAQTTDKKGRELRDRNNPDKTLRERPILGIDMLQNLEYQDGKWVGKLYAPKKGKTLDASVKLVGNDELELTISVYSFSKTQTWKRAE